MGDWEVILHWNYVWTVKEVCCIITWSEQSAKYNEHFTIWESHFCIFLRKMQIHYFKAVLRHIIINRILLKIELCHSFNYYVGPLYLTPSNSYFYITFFSWIFYCHLCNLSTKYVYYPPKSCSYSYLNDFICGHLLYLHIRMKYSLYL